MSIMASAITRMTPGPRMSQGVVHAGVLYTAGQVDARAPDVPGQTRNILAKIDALLEQAGTTRARLLSATIWLADIVTFNEMNAVWEAWIDPSNPPARATHARRTGISRRDFGNCSLSIIRSGRV
jgi:enamine deaminase RidA (YjgF/YER057c/UK114 family)